MTELEEYLATTSVLKVLNLKNRQVKSKAHLRTDEAYQLVLPQGRLLVRLDTSAHLRKAGFPMENLRVRFTYLNCCAKIKLRLGYLCISCRTFWRAPIMTAATVTWFTTTVKGQVQLQRRFVEKQDWKPWATLIEPYRLPTLEAIVAEIEWAEAVEKFVALLSHAPEGKKREDMFNAQDIETAFYHDERLTYLVREATK